MKLTTWTGLMMGAAVATAIALPANALATRFVAHATVSGPVAVRVWVEGGDMFPDYSHVTLWLRADRDCYSSLFLVDTAGYIHVLNASDGWLYGGRTYSFRGCDLGLDRLDGRGIAYVFAVGSPMPFDYSSYGDGVCSDGFGYRVVGDPFVACREFYMSALPATCRWDYVGVGFTRFYVREWVRYPSYLCAGGPFHVRVGDNCRDCANVYASYRGNAAAPYQAMRPAVRYKSDRTTIYHVARHDDRSNTYAPVARGWAHNRSTVMVKDTRRVKTYDATRVVSTSREVARAPKVQPQRANQPRVITHKDARGDGARMVTYKGHGESRGQSVAGSRENGKHKKVREAE